MFIKDLNSKNLLAALTEFNDIDYIYKIRKNKNDRTLYCNFTWLYDHLIKLDLKKRKVKRETVIPVHDKIEAFLKTELGIIS
jgi:hypothetical protein